MEIKKNEIEKIALKLEKYMESKLTPEQQEALSSLLSKRSSSDEKNSPEFFKKSITSTTDDLSNLAEAIQNIAAPHPAQWEYNVWTFKF